MSLCVFASINDLEQRMTALNASVRDLCAHLCVEKFKAFLGNCTA
jgi:hypothetical protein